MGEFLAWCADAGVPSIAHVAPLHVATWIEAQTREIAAPIVKQRLAALRHPFDWLVTGQVVPANPAASVRGPQHIVKGGKTPVLEPAEARAVLDSIDTATPAGVRVRALIALMVYSFARVGARHEGRGRVHAEPPPVGAIAREGRQGARHAVPP